MRRPALSLLLLTVIVPYALAQESELSRARKEFRDTEIAVEKSRFEVPSCDYFSPSLDFGESLKLQAKIGVHDFTVKRLEGGEAVPMADGTPSPYRLRRLDISGHGDFFDIHLLLRRIGTFRRMQLETIETLHLQPRAGGDVQMDVRLVEPCWAEGQIARSKLPPGRTVEEIELAAYRQRVQQLREYLAINERLRARMEPRPIVEAIAVLAVQWEHRALLLTDLQYTEPALTVKGATLGGAARASVDDALKRAALQPATVDWSPAGECRAFTITTRVAGGRAGNDDLLPMNVFDERMATLCGTAPGPPATPVTARGSGNLTLRLRDAPAAALFQLLAELSPADAFIVEPSVTARVDADLDRVTPEEAYAALRAASVAVVGRGPLHRVCKTACSAGPPEPPAGYYKGQPISLSVTDAQVVDVLRVFNQLMAPIEIYGPSKIEGTFSIYAADVPWDCMFDGILAATGRTYTRDEVNTRIYITGDRATAVPINKATSNAGLSRRPFEERDPAKISVDDVRVAALARGKDGVWRAYGRAPGAPGRLFPLTPGLALFDGKVDAVGAEGVTLRTSSGRTVTVPLAVQR